MSLDYGGVAIGDGYGMKELFQLGCSDGDGGSSK
jgi:hypothetical protein